METRRRFITIMPLAGAALLAACGLFPGKQVMAAGWCTACNKKV